MVQTKRRGIRTRLPPDYKPGEFTVLCGRGNEYTASTGNQHLKSLIDKHLKGYSQARGKNPKSAIVSEIMRNVRAVCPDPTFVKFEDGGWWEVDKAFAREKIGCMFRDALHTQYRSSTKAKFARKKAQSSSTTRDEGSVRTIDNMGRSSSLPSSVSSQSYNSTMVQTKRRGIRTRLPPDYKPGEFTVLCGRGNEYTTSTGNQHLKSLIDKHLKGYSQARGKILKSAIVSEIMRNVRAVCPEPTFVKFEDGGWWEVDKAFAREKIGSMFRDALHTQYRSSTKAKFARKKAQSSSITMLRQEENIPTTVDIGRSSSVASSTSSQSYNSTMVQTKRRGIRTRLPPDYVPGEFTVLCGRGKEYTTSTGNQHLKSLIDKHLKGYSQARGKIPKSAIVSEIMRNVRAVCPEPTFVKFEDGGWWEVGNAFAREKIGCMFRDALHTQYRSSTKAKFERKKAQSSSTMRQEESVRTIVSIESSSSVVSSTSSQSYGSSLAEESYEFSLAEESYDSSLAEESYASSLAEDIFGPKSMNRIRQEPALRGDVLHDYGSMFSSYLPAASPRSSDHLTNTFCLATDENMLNDFADDLHPISSYLPAASPRSNDPLKNSSFCFATDEKMLDDFADDLHPISSYLPAAPPRSNDPLKNSTFCLATNEKMLDDFADDLHPISSYLSAVSPRSNDPLKNSTFCLATNENMLDDFADDLHPISSYLPAASPRSSDPLKNSTFCLATDENLLDDFADDLYPIFYYFLLG
eukprot:scaffold3515_cov126-Cylindrotheca_fusiformis.AAC.46